MCVATHCHYKKLKYFICYCVACAQNHIPNGAACGHNATNTYSLIGSNKLKLWHSLVG